MANLSDLVLGVRNYGVDSAGRVKSTDLQKHNRDLQQRQKVSGRIKHLTILNRINVNTGQQYSVSIPYNTAY